MRHPEYQYPDLLEQVLETGDERIDRTGVGTRSIFGSMIRYDLSDGSVPILTTKRVFWKLAVKEMLWFLTGDTNVQPLLRKNVRIWTDWPLASDERLNCLLFQRSVDLLLGQPFFSGIARAIDEWQEGANRVKTAKNLRWHASTCAA